MYPERMLREPRRVVRPRVQPTGAARAGRGGHDPRRRVPASCSATRCERGRSAGRSSTLLARRPRGRPRARRRDGSTARFDLDRSLRTRRRPPFERALDAAARSRSMSDELDDLLVALAARSASSTRSATTAADGRVRPRLGVRRRPARRRSPTRAACSPAIVAFWFERTARPRAQPPARARRPGRLPEIAPRRPSGGPGDARAPAEMLPMECVVRGYLVGSGWKEYRRTGTVGGMPLPAGLREAERLPEPLFTPTTKADEGTTRTSPPTQARRARRRGRASRELGDASLRSTRRRPSTPRARGIILADTKFEFGVTPTASSSLIDEVLTPDSSRYWPADEYEPGTHAAVVRQAVVRDYLETSAGTRRRRPRCRPTSSPAPRSATSRPTSASPAPTSDDLDGDGSEPYEVRCA